MSVNPWEVDSIDVFYFLKCPECAFDTQKENEFQNHAVENHPLSFVLFGDGENLLFEQEKIDETFDSKQNISNHTYDNEDFVLKQPPDLSIVKEEWTESDVDESQNLLFGHEEIDNTFDSEKYISNKDDTNEDFIQEQSPDLSIVKHEEWNESIESHDIVDDEFQNVISEEYEVTSKPIENLKVNESKSKNDQFKTEDTVKKWQCPYCDSTFKFRSKLRVHVDTAHEGRKPYKCTYPECDYKSRTLSGLRKHIEIIHEKKKVSRMLEKPEKSKNFEIANTLQSENFQFIEIKPKRSLKSDETYPCKICDKTFVYKKSLVSHQKFHAMKERPFSCEICQKSFKMKGSLKAHQLTHSVEKPFTCEECDKSFKTSFCLERHNLIHTKEKPYSCRFCNKAFPFQWNVENHERMHTGEKPFKCKICNKKFSTTSALSTHHKQVHNSKKPFSCDLCGKSYKIKSVLQRHYRVHTKETPYSCNFCDKKFQYSWGKKAHERKHTGEKPYLCTICDQRFNNHNSLKHHNSTRHNV